MKKACALVAMLTGAGMAAFAAWGCAYAPKQFLESEAPGALAVGAFAAFCFGAFLCCGE